MHKDALLTAAQHQLNFLQYLVKNHDSYNVMSVYNKLQGIFCIVELMQEDVSEELSDNLTIIKNYAQLLLYLNKWEQIKRKHKETKNYNRYHNMTELELADYLFKSGGRFNDPLAVSVARQRRILVNINNQYIVYRYIHEREKSL